MRIQIFKEKDHQILFVQSSKLFAFVQLLHILHRNQQSHISFICLAKVVELNERNSTLSKLQKSIHYRNTFEIWKIVLLSNLCSSHLLKTQFSAKQWCDFHHNAMRSRWIFDLFDYLDRTHLELENESFVVSFTYWMQMFLRCEIREIAKQWRDVEFRNLIRCSPNSEVVLKNFF